ncbi:hypothetical protein X813_gp39 [Lactobacillus phage LL-Ku]|uniref:Uncharacterized protein n=1 Tax=Lactobacillus phage LL-Ku TaxID=2892343 RepID=F7V9D9_9CAUD|nr:hypothetical protein X813_gp39 [Lactobacillus phage LL-Ku]AAV30200.1 hypothetical protein [Lactobacillus phage LL-Ku]
MFFKKKIRRCAICGDQSMKYIVNFKDGTLCDSCFEKLTGKKAVPLSLKELVGFSQASIADLSSPDYKGVLCPNCGSVHVDLVGKSRKHFSVGKAVGGAFLAGGVGLLAGLAGKNNGTEFFCYTCHKAFKIK